MGIDHLSAGRRHRYISWLLPLMPAINSDADIYVAKQGATTLTG